MTPLLLFILSFAFYLPRSSPSLYGGDSGELIASAHLLGLPHAPGYPLYVLLGKLADVLIPFGNHSLRINIFSAVLASTVLVIFYLLLQNLIEKNKFPWASLLGTIILGTRPFFVDEALSAEVFLLNLLFLLGILLCLVKAQQETDVSFKSRWVLLGFFLFGLGLGNHHTLLVVAPFLVWVIYASTERTSITIYSLLSFLLGLTIYVYLPLRARMNPPVDFGDPQTWSRFWAVVTRKEFGTTSLHPAAVPFRDLPLIYAQVKQFYGRWFSQLGWAGMALTVGGLVAGLFSKKNRMLAFLGGLGICAVGLGFEIYSNLSPGSDIGQWRLERFFLFPLVSSVGLIALFLAMMNQRKIFFKSLSFFLILGMFIEQGRASQLLPSYRSNFIFRDFALSLLRCAPVSTRLVIDRVLFDEPTSACLVLTQVENKRSDVKFYYRPGTLFDLVYGEDFLSKSPSERLARQVDVEQNLMKTNQPIRFFAFEKSNTFFKEPRLEGLLYKDQEREPSAVVNLEEFFIHRGYPSDAWTDYPRRLIAVHWPYFMGKAEMDRGEFSKAERWFDSGLQFGVRMAWLSSNIGGLYSQAEQFDPGLLILAKNCYSKSIEWDPYFSPGYYGFGYTCIRDRHYETSVVAFEQAIRMDPTQSDSFYMLGVANLLAGHKEEGRSAWEKYLALAPDGTQAVSVRKYLNK